MKRLLLFTAILLFVSIAHGQDTTNPKFNETLDKFGLSLKDNRGLVLFYQVDQTCAEESENTKEAIEKFFLQSPKKDITYICIKSEDLYELSGKVLDIDAVIRLYITTTFQN